MTPADEAHLDKHLPQLSALIRALDELDGRQVVVTRLANKKHLAEAVASEFNRAGGPKILPSAVL